MPLKRKAPLRLKQTTLFDVRSSPASSPRASTSKLPSSTRTRKQKRSAAQVPVDDDSDDDVNLRAIKFKPTTSVSLDPAEVYSVKRRRTTLRIHSENSSEESNPVQRKSRRLAIQQNSSEDEGLAVDETQTRKSQKGRILGRKSAISSEKDEKDDSDIVGEVEQDRTHLI